MLPEIPATLWPLLLATPLIAIILSIIYILILKPRLELPLSNELYEGHWTIPLPGIGVLEGPVTTARQTITSLWNKIIDAASSGEKEQLQKLKQHMLENHYFYAIRNSGQKTILIFTDNPLDEKYHIRRDVASRFGHTVTTRFIHGVQNCKDLGEQEGFRWITVTLQGSKTVNPQNPHVESMKYLVRAARNLERIKFLQDEVEFYKEELAATQKELARERSEKERAKRALGQKPLTQEEVPEIKAGWRQAAKRFFSIQQVAACILVYFVTPEILKWANLQLDQTVLSIIVGLATVATFFIVPILQGWLKRRFK